MDAVTQRFDADTAEYTAAIEEAVATAEEFAAANEEAQHAVDSMRDSAVEASAAQAELRDGAVEAGTGLGHERDEALEAAAAMHDLRDSEAEAGAAGAAAGGGGLSMMTIGMVALVGIAGALLPAVAALGLAFGGFALFALPTIKQITGALGDNKAQLDKLPAPIRDAVESVKSLEGAWKTTAKAFQPEVLTAFSTALSIASDLMEKIAPIAMQGAFAVNGILDALKGGVDSGGFSAFLSTLSALVLPVTHALTQLAGTILGILGNAIGQLAPLAVPMINMLNGLLKAAGPALTGALRLIAETVLDLGHAITPLLGPLGAVINFMARHPVFAQMATVILAVVGAVKLWSIAQGVLDVVLTANPIGLIVAAIALLVVGIFELVTHWTTVWHAITAAVDVAVNFIKAHWALIVDILLGPVGIAITQLVQHWNTIKSDATKIIDDIVSWVKGHWALLVEIFGGPVAAIVTLLATHWNTIRSDVSKLVSDVVNFFSALPGKIMAELKALPGQMLSFGESIVNGLLRGVENAAGGLLSEVSSLASKVSGAFSAVLGIFSPSRVFYQHAVNTVQGAIDGWRASAPALLAAVRGTAGAMAGTGSSLVAGAVAPAGGGTSVHVTVPVTAQGMTPDYNDPRFLQFMQGVVQEATLRYGQVNPGNGFTSQWGR